MKTWVKWKLISEQWDLSVILIIQTHKSTPPTHCAAVSHYRLQTSLLEFLQGTKMPTLVLDSADCHVNSVALSLFLHAGIMIQRSGVPCGDKMSLFKHAGVTMWYSLTAVTMANICKWRRMPLSLRPHRSDTDTSYRTPNMLGKKLGQINRKKSTTETKSGEVDRCNTVTVVRSALKWLLL